MTNTPNTHNTLKYLKILLKWLSINMKWNGWELHPAAEFSKWSSILTLIRKRFLRKWTLVPLSLWPPSFGKELLSLWSSLWERHFHNAIKHNKWQSFVIVIFKKNKNGQIYDVHIHIWIWSRRDVTARNEELKLGEG